MNFRLPKVKTLLSLAAVLFLTAGVLAGSLITQTKQNISKKAAASTILSISPKTKNVNLNEDVTFSVVMDTGSNSVTGLDIILKFNSNIFHVNSIERGSGIDSFDNVITDNFNNSNGTIGYTAFTLDKKLAVQGTSVEVLRINAKVNSNAIPGVYNLVFDPTTAVSATNESQNALTDTVPGVVTVLNPTPSPTTSPTNPPGEPNSCGGTCGSNSNCRSNLYCYQGYCRNPNCGWDSTCNCNSPTNSPTPIPTKTASATSKPASNMTNAPTAKPNITTAPIVINTTAAPTPTNNSFWQNIFNNTNQVPVVTPTISPIDLPQTKSDSMLPWIIGSLVAVGITLIIIAVGVLKNDGVHKTKPPVIEI